MNQLFSNFQTGCSNYLTPWWFLSNSMCASFYRQTITSKQILWAGCCTSYLRLSSSRNVGSFYKNHSSICVFLYLCICVCPVLGMLLRSFNCIFVFVYLRIYVFVHLHICVIVYLWFCVFVYLCICVQFQECWWEVLIQITVVPQTKETFALCKLSSYSWEARDIYIAVFATIIDNNKIKGNPRLYY